MDWNEPRNPACDRETLMLALAAIAAEQGLAAATPATIVDRAGLPRDEFGHHFRSAEDCVLALYDATVRALRAAVDDAIAPCTTVGGPDAWRRQLEAGFGAALGYLAALPDVAVTCVVEAPVLGQPVLERRDTALERFVGYVDVLRRVQDEPVPRLAAEMMVRGTYELVHARVAAGDAERLPLLMNDLRPLWAGPYGDGSARPRRFTREPPAG